MFDIISIILTFGALIAWGIHRQKKKHNALLAKFRGHNRRLGTSFPDTSIDSDLILIGRAKKIRHRIRSGSKKICLVLGSKDQGEVLDFSFIRQWQLK
jgi:hypothetical protein